MLSKHCCEMNSLRKTDLKKNFNLIQKLSPKGNLFSIKSKKSAV